MAFDRTRNGASARACRRAASLSLLLMLTVPASEAAAQAAPPMRGPTIGGPGPAIARSFTINELLARHGAGRARAAGRVVQVETPGRARDAVPVPRGAWGPEPFGLHALRAPEGELWTKWRGLEAALAREADETEACRADAKQCSPEARRYLAIVAETRARTGRARLETANRLVNGAIRYASDRQRHGVADRWTAPLASLDAGEGDCEDYAIAKFAVLRDAGVAEHDMRLVLLRDTSLRLDHAVLAVRHEGEWLVLDNRRAFVAGTGELRHYMPLFALDREGVKLFAARYAGLRAGEQPAPSASEGGERPARILEDDRAGYARAFAARDGAIWGEGAGDPRVRPGDERFADWTLRGSADFALGAAGEGLEPAAGAGEAAALAGAI